MGGPGSGRKPSGKSITISKNGKKISFSPKQAARARLHNSKNIKSKRIVAAVSKLSRLRKEYLGKSEGRARKY